MTQNIGKNSRQQFFFMLLVFLAPALVSWLLYHYHAYFQLHTSNHGILVTPSPQVQYLYANKQNDARPVWRIIYMAGKNCDAVCQKMDYQLHQVQKALGKDRNRVSVMMLDKSDVLPNKWASVIYLVDPLGYLFMYYPSTTDPMNVFKDIKHVLEVSQIG